MLLQRAAEVIARRIGEGVTPVRQEPRLDKIREALGLAFTADEADILARINRGTDQTVEGAIAAGRIRPDQREWARSYARSDLMGFRAFLATTEPVDRRSAGAELADLARTHAAANDESLADAQRAIARQRPDLYYAARAGRATVEQDPRREGIRHAASTALATLTRITRERQRCGWDEAVRIVMATPAHRELFWQRLTGTTDMPAEFDPAGAAAVGGPLLDGGTGGVTNVTS